MAEGERRAAVLKLAAQGPVHRVTLPNGALAWLVTGNAEARQALTDPRLARGSSGVVFSTELPEIADAIQNHMLNKNPPDHTRLRKLVNAAFTRRRVEMLEPQIEAIAADLIDEIGPVFDRGDVVNLDEAFAHPFPFRVICTLLGIPRQDEAELGKWFVVLTAGVVWGLQAYTEAATKMLTFLRALIDEKRRNPSDDLTSALVRVRDGEDQLTENELTAMMFLLFAAGHETTSSLITSGVLTLLRHPDQLSAVRAQPELMESAVEEMLRYDGVVQATFPAMALETFELGGTTIESGDAVTVSLAAANMDPRVHEDPDRFDVTRHASHLAFGYGVHHCLGAPLARLEARIALSALLARFPSFELADNNLERLPSFLFHRLSALPIRRTVE